MQYGNSHLEVPDADSVISGLPDFLCFVIHGVKFTDFVDVPDGFEHFLYFFARSQLTEVSLLDADLGVVRWEQQVNSLWFVAVVLK